MNPPKIHPYNPIIIGVISVSLSAIFAKLANAESSVIAFYRMFFLVMIMAPLFFWKYINEVKKLMRRDWVFSSIAGVFLAFHFILWFESLQYTSVASSTVLVTLQPLFAFIGTFLFFKEKISRKTILAGVIAIAGRFPTKRYCLLWRSTGTHCLYISNGVFTSWSRRPQTVVIGYVYDDCLLG